VKGHEMELFGRADFKLLSNPGVESMQLLSPHNSTSSRVTITSVTVAPGAAQPRHRHQTSEQIWIAIEGSGTLLLDEDRTAHFEKGQVARFEDGDVHGFENTGDVPFVYISVTSPPIDFSYAYKVAA
jgi:mannose-6-phosphate isomerase-like protein (cupin superfamily)